MMQTMLILRGNSGFYDGQDWPHGALDTVSAARYAELRGYASQLVDCSHNGPFTGITAEQTNRAIHAFRIDPTVSALYGFSGGGYNVHWMLRRMVPEERTRIKLVVVLGAPEAPQKLYEGNWELVYRLDPPASAGGHMAGPRVLLTDYIFTNTQRKQHETKT